MRLLTFILPVISIGCGEDENPIRLMQHMIAISGLDVTSQMLNAGDTTTVTALINYSGSRASLIYTWKASGGTVVGNASSVTYLAPEAPGRHTITLELTDGFEVNVHSITIEVVVPHSLPIDSHAYWPNEDLMVA